MKNAGNRLGIFVFYDKDGVADDYVLHILTELSTVTKRLVIVCNGKVRSSCFTLFRQYSADILIRKNIGYDACAYKEALEQYLQWDQVLRYDELLLANDTYFGPFVPFADIFDRMDKRSCDFWGLTSQGERKDINQPYHIQGYFIVIRKRLLHSSVFFDFWNTLAEIRTYNDAVHSFELRMTSYFQANGFECLTLCDSTKLDSANKREDYSYIFFNSYRMMEEFGAPIIKRKCFSLPAADLFRYSSREDAKRSIDYIQNHTDYDTGMIWKHLIRQLNPKQLADSLGLTYILPYRRSPAMDITRKKIAILAHIYYNDAAKVETCFSYLQNVPTSIDIYITTSLPDTKELIQDAAKRHNITNYQIVMIGNRGREIRGMLVECADIFRRYEYVCFVHDKKTTGGFPVPEVGDSFMYLLWDNMLKSEQYIYNILDIFEKNPCLGILAPPPPYHWRYFSDIRTTWCGDFHVSKKLEESLQLNCVMSREYSPITIGTAYWCRTSALHPLIDCHFQPEDFPPEPMQTNGTICHAIERIFSFVAQHAGYASGIVMNDEYAALHLSNYQECVMTLSRDNLTGEEIFSCDPLTLRSEPIRMMYHRFRDVYVYGAGEIAGDVIRCLLQMGLEPKGCIVSDGRKRTDDFCGCPVWELSELELDQEHTGIILALNKENQRQVLPSLLARQFTNIYLGG
jgi:rhamnosyltransferase